MDENTQDISVSLLEVYERAKVDINFFASLALPEICTTPMPPFYVAAWRILLSEEDINPNLLLRFALGLPRGHAKTTFVKILIAWLIVYDHIHFALIICASSELADSLLGDIHDILTSSNIVQVYGSWDAGLTTDSADTKKALYHGRSVILVARGWKAGVRGLNIKNRRPDFIFCDDAQTKQNDESPSERDKLLTELTGSIFKAIPLRGRRRIVYVGNMYSEECILNLLRKNTSWYSMVTGAILSDGLPLWPALYSIQELKDSYIHDEQLGKSHIWFAEVMNDPKSTSHSLLPNPLPPSPLSLTSSEMHDGCFLTIDPAGFRKHSDENVIAVHYRISSSFYVAEVSRGILNPEDVIREALRLAIKHNACFIGVEDTGYQQTLGFWLTKYLSFHGITHIVVAPLSPHGRSKESRIRLFIQELYSLNYSFLQDKDRSDFVWQASLYKIGSKDNKDDLLDALAYGLDVRNEYGHLLVSPKATAHFLSSLPSVEENMYLFQD